MAEPRPTLDFSKTKINIRRTGDKIFASIDERGYLNLNSVHNVIIKDNFFYSPKYILCILNSSLIDYIYRNLVPDDGRVFSEVKIINLKKLPIHKATPEEQNPLIQNVDRILKLNNNLQKETNSFKDWFIHTFNIEKLSQKLEKYYELSIDSFLNEVKKKKVNVKSRENYQTLKEEFEKSVRVINPLLQQIMETDSEIDQMVYDLYGLTPEEIKIIEESLDG
ncbi:TaqI-like C-terminal specificity domain-containing protein [Methanobacterium sp. SMA-27]|uniref:TaqI-like C-terminal specificity domain-containing protein n=1 Tax=Methanobacterium sp. SMA-27 TaxID=1495336 RepID=UPI002101CBF3|nr:TaqI-like C-terminal specificity domain-containing protein [Methanobacterium sp. SMA-27]